MARVLRPERGDVIRFGLDRLVRGGVRGVWVRGSLPRGPVVWAANHHSWWDGFAAASVLRAAGRTPALLMDGDNLGDYAFLRRAGVIPATQPRAALAALRQDQVLIVFPEGELRPVGPLGPLRPGAQWLAAQAPATLVAVALRVANRGHQSAEIYVDLAAVPTTGGSPADVELAGTMADGLARLDADLLAADPREPLPGFLLTVPGKSSWDERIARWSSVLRR
jgi:1-acyl-sn-glycerol-3-phosphate acyltransferase